MLFKRFISAFTSAAMAFSMLGILPAAAEENMMGGSTSVTDTDVDVTGTNSFGNMLAEELEAEAAKQEANAGNNIFEVEVSGNTAKVDYQTTVDCSLVVGIYTEDGKDMLATGTAQASTDAELAEVTFDTDTMPQYFYVKAFLVDEVNFRPLSTVYESPMYTQEMQEFLAKTTADFDEDRVLNLDEDDTTNFAVYGEDVILLDAQEDGLTTDDESGVYTFEDASDRVKNLQEGDVIACGDAEDVVIVSVKGVEVEGDTVKITEDPDAELEDVFEYVKIESDPNQGEAEIDTSDLPEGVTYLGREETTEQQLNADGYDAVGQELNAIEMGGELSGKAEFEVKAEAGQKYTGRDKDGNVLKQPTRKGNVSLKGKFAFGAKGSVKVYLSWSYRYLEFKLDYDVNFDIKLTIDGYIAVPLATWKIKPIPGVNIEFVPSLVFEGKMELEYKFSLKGTWGIKISNQGNENLTKEPKINSEFKVKGKLFVGISFAPKLSIIHDNVAKATMEATIGLVLEAKLKDNYTDMSKYPGMTEEQLFDKALNDSKISSVHTCNNCLELTLSFKVEVKATVSFIKDWIKLEGKVGAEWVIWKGHWSLTYNHFGSGGCPHEKYKTAIRVEEFFNAVDDNDVFIKNAKVVIDGKTYSTGDNRTLKLMLSNGKYSVDASSGIMKGTRDFTIDNSKANILILVIDPNDAVEVMSYTMTHIFDIPHTFSDNTQDNDNKDDKKDKPGDLSIPDNDDKDNKKDNTGNDMIEGKKVIQVALGSFHSACITEDGSLYTWGYNEYGHLGDGTTDDKYSPVKIMNNASQVYLSDGYHHTSGGDGFSACITKDGSLYTWGHNGYGQLGNGLRSYSYDENENNKYIPVKILDNVTDVSIREDHSACITKDGSLYTWGENYYGVLGDGSCTSYDYGNYVDNNKYSPIKILDNVTQVSLGLYHSACITTDGSLYTWGCNRYGELGDGTTEEKHTPVKIMDNVAKVSLGFYHSACITTDGSLYTWGANDNGQLGDGTEYDIFAEKYKNKPVKIMDNVVQVSLGYSSTACITKDGSLYTWGNNSYGQLGDGTTVNKLTPIKIMNNVEHICFTQFNDGDGEGCQHSSCITQDGSLYIWGNNSYGQLGDGTTVNKLTPIKIMNNVAQVSLGYLSTASITQDGSLYTWGTNYDGQLGDGTREIKLVPTKIIIPKDAPTTTAQTLNADTQKQQTIIPNEVYNVYAVQDINAGLIDDNILYIDQQTADENGKLDYDHGLKGKVDSVVWFAVPMYQQDISGAEVKLDDLEYTGEEQFVHPVVKLDGEELTEGVDYYLEGAYSATEGGEYTVTIKGTGLYTGEVSVTYKVNGGKTAVTLGDVNHDEQINVTDIAMIAAHIKGIKALDENAVKAADVNGDTEVNVTDIAMVAAHIKGIKAIG